MDKKELQKILEGHVKWLDGKSDGVKANLERANLRGANLQEANLERANLRGANLQEAYLRGANLRGAKNLPLIYVRSPLNLFKFQKGKLKAFKYLNKNMKSPYQHFQYEIGKTYKFDDCSGDETIICDKGGNVATLDWCLEDTNCDLDNKIYVEVEFDVKDIGAIPYVSDGKFRVKKFKITRKLTKKEIEKYIKG